MSAEMSTLLTGPVIPEGLLALTPREQFLELYHEIYERHLDAYPSDAKLTISYPSGRPGEVDSTGKAGQAPLDSEHIDLRDRDAIWACIERRQAPPAKPGQPGGNSWIGVAPRIGGLKRSRRGTAAECYPIPAMFVDLDVSVDGAQHKHKDLPTLAQAEEMIEACPTQPSVTIWTGGGFHLWWGLQPGSLLDKGIAPSSKERKAGAATPRTEAQQADADLIARHKAWWLDEAERREVYIDASVIGTTTQVLRMAGSTNGKYGSTCQIVKNDKIFRYGRADWEEMLPPLPEKTVKARESRKARVEEVREAIDSGHARPGDRLAAEVPVSDLLVALGMTETGGTGWWSPGGGADHPVHARMYCDPEGRESVTAFDRSLRERWGLEDDHHSLDGWTLLGRVLCAGDWALAGRIAKAFSNNWPGLLDLVTERLEPEELAQRYPPAAAVKAISPAARRRLAKAETGRESAKFEATGDPVAWQDAVAAGSGWAPIKTTQAGELFFARLGTNPGVWREYIEYIAPPDGGKGTIAQTQYERIADWVPWRSAVIRHRRGDTEAAEPQWTVKIHTADGVTRSIDLDGKKSLDINLLQAATGAPIDVPPSAVHIAWLRDCLAKLGHEQRAERVRYIAAGWVTDRAGHMVMAAPAGSVCAAGIRHDIDVEVAGDDPTMASIGWTEVSHTAAERKAGIEALMELIGLAPTRPEHGVDVLGALFSAPLRLSRRAGHLSIGKKGSGKSLCASAAFAAMAGIGMDGSSFPVKLTSASKAGVHAKAAWHTDMVVFADNYKQKASRSAAKENQVATDALGVLLDGSYDGVQDSKSNLDGTARAVVPVKTTAYVTGEVIPDDDASSVERSITVTLFKGQVDLLGGGAIDRYRELHVRTGNARRGLADYLQWLAGQVDGGGELTGDGGLTGLRAWADEAKRVHAAQFGSERAGETVATDATGWQAYRAYARAQGIESSMPAAGQVNHWLGLLLASTVGVHADADPGPHVLQGLVGMLSQGRGHLVSAHGAEPRWSDQLGWCQTTTSGEHSTHTSRPGGVCLGRLSADGEYVCLNREAPRAAAAFAGLPGLKPAQLIEALRAYVEPKTEPGEEAPARFGLQGRHRSYILPAWLFGIGELPVETDALVLTLVPEMDADDDDWSDSVESVTYLDDLLSDPYAS